MRRRLTESLPLIAQRPDKTRTPAAHHPNRACGPCAPALRAGALLASPDAQTALPKAFLTSPPHRKNPGRRGQERSKARPVRPAGQGQSQNQGQSQGQSQNPYGRPAASICHAPRGTRQHRHQPGCRGTTPTTVTPSIVGLRPPTATLRAAHDSTASNHQRGRQQERPKSRHSRPLK